MLAAAAMAVAIALPVMAQTGLYLARAGDCVSCHLAGIAPADSTGRAQSDAGTGR
jgi:hypothetical protein